MPPRPWRRAKRVNRRCRSGAGETKGEKTAGERGDEAELGMAAPVVAQGFAPNADLMSGERDRNKRGSKQLSGGTGQGVQTTLRCGGYRCIPPGATGNKRRE